MLQHIMLVPYTDVTLWPTFDISTAPAKNYLLGFVVADFDSQPSWGGYHKTTSDFYLDTISKVRKNGGDVFVSFGGASGRELATVIQSREQLFLAYKQVVDKYKLKQIDLDIEGLPAGESKTAADVVLPAGVVLKSDPKMVVVHLSVRATADEAAPVAAAAEGEAAAAAPAEGAAEAKSS